MIVKGPHPTIEPGIIFLQISSELNPKPLVMCSIESAARLNPNKPVYFFMKAFTGNVSAFREPEYKAIPLLSSFKNVIILPLNFKELFNNTPLAGWYEKVDPSKEVYWIYVLSDACRMTSLWKYGGIYLDTDVISIKPLEFGNFIVAESEIYSSSAVLGFNRSHPFLENCLTDFVEKYNGADWGQQGPKLITRNLKKWCGTDNLNQFLNKECKGIDLPDRPCDREKHSLLGIAHMPPTRGMFLCGPYLFADMMRPNGYYAGAFMMILLTRMMHWNGSQQGIS
ncbi:alpha-1,4-N-acetylglucosaminyltransferase-like [Hemiscyllium ocellatum]|uniref:alpha-1,4-N-acetylglucosaminyltransferase-like n=1 Tax=Hemiscyllium ocellatum TaxID=170820 RepID=UPI002966B1C9|nr:alpha-1,4-N-acetylglucosaminyltransferase-like [Hemiscyllium ocellatum]